MSITLVRQQALTHFAENLVSVYSRSLREVWIVSPWITTSESFYALNTILSVITSRQAALTAITRPAEKVNHQAAVRALQAIPQSEVFTLRDLHAKIYIAECDGFSAALIGSANFTAEGDATWIEVTADIRSSKSSDESATFITDLVTFCRELTVHMDSERIKTREPRWWQTRHLR